MFSSNQEFYNYVEMLIVWLRENGNAHASNDLDSALHKGFTSGEIFDDLLGSFSRLKAQKVFCGSKYEIDVDRIITELTKLVNS